MTKEMTKQLYNSVEKLMMLLEDEISILEMQDGSAIKVKRNITETLNKLVSLLAQINKMDEEKEDDDGMEANDQDIIDGFLARSKMVE